MKIRINAMLTSVLILSLQYYNIAAMDNQSSYRAQAIKKLPKISDENPKIDTCLITGPEITYNDNHFIEQFIKLLGGIATETLPDENDINQKIMNSIPVKMGQWKILQGPTPDLSTGNVIECVTVSIQHKEPMLTGLYHYFERDDIEFQKLLEFIKEIKEKSETQSIDISALKVSLITSYLSPNLLAIKDILESHDFKINLIHARPRCWLDKTCMVTCEQNTNASGRLIFVSPSNLKIYQSHFNDPGDYGPENPVTFDDACYLM